MKRTFLIAIMALLSYTCFAQRMTDKLDRGVVAVPTGSGGFLVSWRIFAEEYYDTKYNIYRNGTKLNAEPLSVSNYTDTGGAANSNYQVAAVVKGVEQVKSAAVTPWANGYWDIVMQPIYARGGTDVTTSHGYIINDTGLGDVDGDGVAEFFVKRLNTLDLNQTANDSCFDVIECYNMAGDRLWWIDCGPNMMTGGGVELNIGIYDWDGDGKCEAAMRGADGMIIHMANGKTYEVGDMTIDSRWDGISFSEPGYAEGQEYLLYLNGATGEPYQIIDYPLPYFEDDDLRDAAAVWGGGIPGHRPNKHFIGAPVLDGRNPSIFLARGIYTQIKMCAYDVDPQTHQLTRRWFWRCKDSTSPWFAQGYHNYAVADVDMDGRDEIVYGSMVIDDNGKGLSTTGLGHGDAQHCGDFDPYRWGLEQFACNEFQPAMNYRNATTSEIYYRRVASGDDGRAICGNFTNDLPGCLGRSVGTGMISTLADKEVTSKSGWVDWGIQVNRIYWDGDLCDEILASPGIEREGVVYKPGNCDRIFQSAGCQMCNYTKNTPAAQGDIIGDWREEIVLRAEGNTRLRIYTTPIETKWRNYTLWHDHQYRQAMVWEMCGYNQPPHVSYFVGEMEGITTTPPPLTMTGRTEISNGGTISAATDGQHIIVCETNDTKISVANGAKPYIATFNVPSWVQGHDDNDSITYDHFTCTVSGGAFGGSMRLVKQGEGTLILPSVEQTYTGNTDIWGGTLQFSGTLKKSPLWLNRFTTLESNGGTFRSIRADYAAKVCPGGIDSQGSITADTLNLGFGSRVQFDLYAETLSADTINAKILRIETKDWKYGPKYMQPIFEFIAHTGSADTLRTGRYFLGNVTNIVGAIDSIVIEGLPNTQKAELLRESGKLYLQISSVRGASAIIWNGNESDNWNFAKARNFTLAADPTQTTQYFVTNDYVIFDNSAEQRSVKLTGDLAADTVLVSSDSDYTFTGTGTLAGATALVKQGSGTLTISNSPNSYTGGTRISGGKVVVESLASEYQQSGALGALAQDYGNLVIENGAELNITEASLIDTPITIESDEGGIISNKATVSVRKAVQGTNLVKKGTGWMQMTVPNYSLKHLTIGEGTVHLIGQNNPAQKVEFQGGTLEETMDGSSFPIFVDEGQTGTWRLTGRASYSNTITGAGELTIYMPELGGYEGVPRTPINGNWSKFTGTIKATTKSNAVAFTFDNSYGLPNATLDIQEGRTIKNTAGKTFAIGKVTGDKGILGGIVWFTSTAVTGKCTWALGNNEDWKWKGLITGDCNFIKQGKGKVTLLSSAHDFTGTANIKKGELHIGTGVTLGTNTLTVATGATLSGVTGTGNDLTNTNATIKGTLQVGLNETATSGVINFGNKNVTFSKGSTLKVRAKRCATKTTTGGTYMGNILNLVMNGTIDVSVPEDHSLSVGDSIIVWKANKTTGKPTLKSYVIDETAGLYWDDSNILNGVLYVTDQVPTAIAAITDDTPVSVQVFTLSGAAVSQFTCTKAEVAQRFSQTSLPQGIYVVSMQANGIAETRKLRK